MPPCFPHVTVKPCLLFTWSSKTHLKENLTFNPRPKWALVDLSHDSLTLKT